MADCDHAEWLDEVDKAIHYWRLVRDDEENDSSKRLQAVDYVDAYQSVRRMMTGKPLPV